MTIQAHYDAATPAQITQGWKWYSDARCAASQMHDHLPTAVGVIAALSPRVRWEHNLKLADELIKTGYVRGVLSRNVYKARLILECKSASGPCGAPVEHLSGPKVTAFYYAILDPFGNTDPVVDSHILRAAYGQTTRPTTRTIRVVQDEIRNLAEAEGIPIHVAQATVWLKVRER